MDSEATRQAFRFRTKETPEGLAFYPLGTWGAGYILDARTEARIKRFLDRQVWIVVVCLAIIMPLPLHAVFKALLCGVVGSATISLGLQCIARHGRRVEARLTSNELLRRRAASLAFPEVYAMVVISASLLAYCIGGVLLSSAVVDRWLWAGGALAIVAVSAVHTGRLVHARRRYARSG